MGESELGKALLELDAANLAGLPDMRQLTWRVLERDRRRVRRLTWLTVGVWLLAVGLIVLVLVWFGLLFPRQAQLALAVEAGVEAGKIPEARRAQLQRQLQVSFQMGTLTIAFSVLVLALAALCTVLLVSASRRATLRQVNAGLLEVSEQLKVLRQALGK
jgi:hypothetical protein